MLSSEGHLGCFCVFDPDFWEGVRDVSVILCLSVLVVGTTIGGGNSQTLTSINEFI